MKKALVLGASGGMGYSIVNELTDRGIEVVAFARRKDRLMQLFHQNNLVTVKEGDLRKKEDVISAAKGADVIFHSANIPYSQWEEDLAQIVRHIVEAAKVQSAKLAVVDNIYAYGRKPNELVTENAPKNPHTKKGKIRLQLEQIYQASHVPTIIAHFPDFYGPNASNTLLHYTFEKVVKNKNTGIIGNKNIAREFIYTPDGAKAIVELALTDKAYNQNWNIPGYRVITGEEIITILRQTVNYHRKVSTVTKAMIQFLGLFSKDMREVVEMFYLNEEPVVLSGEKYENEIGKIPKTPYKEGIKETIEYMRRKNNR
ncbi:short chain dehydrogenase [Bacillus sp. 7586-K]|nr:short chain dehydrogenase [Bacillus sp. 7586-K]